MVEHLQVLILATGHGTGLRPLTVDRPKVLAPVCNITILRRILEQIESAGIHRASLVVRPIPRSVQDLLIAETPDGFELVLSVVPESIDGSLPVARYAWSAAASSVFVIYGDSLLSADFPALLRFHRSVVQKSGLCTILYHQPDDLRADRGNGRSYHGVMSVDKKGRITRFTEKPDINDVQDGFDLASAAVFICERGLLDHPTVQDARDFSTDVFERLAGANSTALYGFGIGYGFRRDVGTLERLFDVNKQILRRELRVSIPGREVTPNAWLGNNTEYRAEQVVPPVAIGCGVRIGKGARIGPGVVVGDRCAIGEDVVLSNAVLMHDCVIGPGVRADTCILGPYCHVRGGAILPPFSAIGAYGIIGGKNWNN